MAIVANNKTETIIDKLEKSKFSFYLTGSKYFGQDTALSDTDYFVEDSCEIRQFLEKLGFEVISATHPDYTNKTLDIEDILETKDHFVGRSSKTIHIQLIKPDWLPAKVQTQKDIETFFNTSAFYSLDKHIRQMIWKAFIRKNKNEGK